MQTEHVHKPHREDFSRVLRETLAEAGVALRLKDLSVMQFEVKLLRNFFHYTA